MTTRDRFLASAAPDRVRLWVGVIAVGIGVALIAILVGWFVIQEEASQRERRLLEAELNAIEHVGSPYGGGIEYRSITRRFSSRLSDHELFAHYEAELGRTGWLRRDSGQDALGRLWSCYTKGELTTVVERWDPTTHAVEVSVSSHLC